MAVGVDERKKARKRRNQRMQKEKNIQGREKNENFDQSAENNNKVRIYKKHGFFFCSVSKTEASVFSVME